MGRLYQLNRALKAFDSELEARSQEPPRIDIFRQGRDKVAPPYYIFSLTENWGLRGKPVEWGIEPILARLKAIDLWNQGVTSVDNLVAEQERVEEGKMRDFRNNTESFLKDFRRQFARATNDVNTALMDKKKGPKHGNL